MSPGWKSVARPFRRIAALLPALATAACVAAQGSPVAELGSGGFQMTVKTPTDWQPLNDPTHPRENNFACKPLACRYPAVINVATEPSKMRHPDPAELDRYAKETVPRQVEAVNATKLPLDDGLTHSDILRSEAGTVNGYPAVIQVYKQIAEGKQRFLLVDTLFVGPLRVDVKSESSDRGQAEKGLSLILQNVTFRNVPTS